VRDENVRRLLPLLVASSAVMLSFPRLDAQRQAFSTGAPAELAVARSIGLEHLRGTASQKAIDGPNDLVVSGAHVDRRAMAHTRVQQFFRGVRVFGGEAIAHMNPDGTVFGETDDLVAGVNVDPTPRVTAADAIRIATADYGCSQCLTAAPTADLWILRDEAGLDHLVFRVQMRRIDGSPQTAMPVRFVDAHSGYVVHSYDNLQTGTGVSLYSGTVTIGTRFNPIFGDYAMQNHSLRAGTFDMMNTTEFYWAFFDPDDVWDSPLQQAAVDAHFGMEKYYDYLSAVHGRNGMDGFGGPFTLPGDDPARTTLVASLVHYGSGYNNAFWNGIRMVYGDGDGVAFSPLVPLDIVGHEMTHGVTQFTAGLIFDGESGALSESWSDVFGAMTERYVRGENTDTWLIGEQAFTPGSPGDAIRYLQDPHLAADRGTYTPDDDPDHYSERYTGLGDNGGVHINAGIANKAFYLLAQGGSHHLGGSMTGIGADQAARIWFTALTSYMTSRTDFLGARNATELAAAALHGSGSAQAQAVAAAWCLVGVGVCAVSVTPNAGAGVTQTFTLQYLDSLGAGADLKSARVRFGASNVGPGTCTAKYNAMTGGIKLLNDAGTAWESGSLGTGTLVNGQCTLNLASSSAKLGGNSLTLVLNVTFKGSFTGQKQIYMLAKSAGGASTGWIQRGTWTTNAPTGPNVVSVTPAAASGITQAFMLQYSDSSGAANLTSVRVRFGAANVGPGTCTARYRPGARAMELLNDAGTAWTVGTLPGTGTLSNSQCTLNLAGSAATPSGNHLTVLLNITFSASFTGQKTVFMFAANASQKSGWQARGTWTVPAPGPNAASVTPSAGAGLAQVFTLRYSDTAGAANLTSARVRFGAANVDPGTCTANYRPLAGAIELLNDAGTAWTAGTLGTGTPLSNSQCTLNLAGSTATLSGNDLTVLLNITFSASFAGQKTVYMEATSSGGLSTGWQQRGSWTVEQPPVLALLSMDSQPGDPVGGGFQYIYTAADATFTILRSQPALNVLVTGPSFWWNLDFAASGNSPLQPGAYEGATSYPFNAGNGLSVSVNGRGCGQLTGRFVVNEIIHDAGGVLQRLSVDFEQHCDGGAPALFGTLTYNVTGP
jgi:Zn-dependent metalloprotease